MAWENTSLYFIRSSVKGQKCVDESGQVFYDKFGFEFCHINEYEEVYFYVPNHALQRSKNRIVEHTDMILLVWEHFISSTSYLDFVTEGTEFILRISGSEFVLPMVCTEMSEKRVFFQLRTTDRNRDRKHSFSVRTNDVVIDCRIAGASVEFEEADESTIDRYEKRIAI